MNLQICYLKTYVSCGASVNFHYDLTTCHACHGICTSSPLDAALTMRFAKIRNTTRLKCCACHSKWRWARPKCCACHKNCNASSENVAKVLRLPHTTTFDTFSLNVTKCHACHAKRSNAMCATSKSDTFCPPQNLAQAWPYEARADSCGRLRPVAQRRARTPNPQTPRVKR